MEKKLPIPAATRKLVIPTSFVVGSAGLVGLFVTTYPVLMILVMLAGYGLFLATWAIGKLEASSAQQKTPFSAEQERLKRLKKALSKCQYETDSEKPAEKALDQLRQAGERFKNFERLLGEKLSPSELTYSRYHGAAQQVQHSVLDQLEKIASTLTSINSMGLEDVQTRLKTAQGPELEALRKRIEIKDGQLALVEGLLVENERALTELDRVNLAISEMKTQDARVNTDLPTLMKELEELAQRAKRYS